MIACAAPLHRRGVDQQAGLADNLSEHRLVGCDDRQACILNFKQRQAKPSAWLVEIRKSHPPPARGFFRWAHSVQHHADAGLQPFRFAAPAFTANNIEGGIIPRVRSAAQ